MRMLTSPIMGLNEDVPKLAPSRAFLTRRRLIFALVVGLAASGLTVELVRILAPRGLGLLELFLIAIFLFQVPAVVIPFCNALLGFIFRLGFSDPIARAFLGTVQARDTDAIFTRTAVTMFLRNEDSVRAFALLRFIKKNLDAMGHGDQFDYFILSDSSHSDVIAAEAQALKEWQSEIANKGRLFYRNRTANIGFKGGNLRDFCEVWGNDYDFAVLLDADSLMTGDSIIRFIRIMQANPKLGILQTLIVNLPSDSVFARVFEFGHRHAMRCGIVGAGWWQGDRCQFWGHNALIRLKPFLEFGQLPILTGGPPLGGHIICHDQIEAALIQRGGYDVVTYPEESGSYEGSPPTLLDFIQRNHRWCQGNLQNLRLLGTPRFSAMSRFHLVHVAHRFLAWAAVIIFAALLALEVGTWPANVLIPRTDIIWLYAIWLGLYFMPKLLGLAEALLCSRERYGGIIKLLVGAMTELVFTFLLAPVVMFAATQFMAALFYGRTITWNGQRRDGYRLSLRDTARFLWPATVFGAAMIMFLLIMAPDAILWFFPLLVGLILAGPFAIVTSLPKLGTWAARSKLCGCPEEIEPRAASEITAMAESRR